MNPTAENDFSTGSIPAHMLRLALPMTLAQLINVLYNIIDRIFIGRIPFDSTNALTGLGVAFPICTITIAFANLVGMGGAPLFSIERGKRNDAEAEKILGNSFVLLLLFGLFITITGLLLKRPLLYLLGASEATFRYADSYITIYLCGSVFVMLSLGLNSFINAQGFAKTGMLTVSIGAVCNLLLDPVFIFLLGLGVQGAALATVISQFIAALWTFTFLTGKKTMIRLSPKQFALGRKRVRKILALGLSGFTMSITNSAVQMAGNASLSIHGGDLYIAAMTVINSVREIITMPVTGLTSGAQPVMSFNYGAKKTDRVKKADRLLMICSFTYTMIFCLAVEIAPGFLVHLFNSSSQELFEMTKWALRIYMAATGVFGIQLAVQQVFMALGQAKISLFIACLRKIILLIPLIYILPHFFADKVFAVFLAEPVSDFISVTVAATLFFLNIKKILKEGEV